MSSRSYRGTRSVPARDLTVLAFRFREEPVSRAADFRGDTSAFAEGRDSHQVQFVVNIGGRRQITHRVLERLVPKPVLHGRASNPRRSIPVA